MVQVLVVGLEDSRLMNQSKRGRRGYRTVGSTRRHILSYVTRIASDLHYSKMISFPSLKTGRYMEDSNFHVDFSRF